MNTIIQLLLIFKKTLNINYRIMPPALTSKSVTLSKLSEITPIDNWGLNSILKASHFISLRLKLIIILVF